MSLQKIEAYKCEWCGRIFPTDRTMHASECKYDPQARTCVSCVFSGDLVQADRSLPERERATGVYCPRADKLFLYPHGKYCYCYEKNPHFVSLREEG